MNQKVHRTFENDLSVSVTIFSGLAVGWDFFVISFTLVRKYINI